jgi:tetratricopeptide (TPR) repeat protein
MQVAAVIGREFAYRLLESIMGMKEGLKSHLLDLQDLELIYQKRLFPELEYIFKHVLIQEVAYTSLLLRRRKEFHKKIADAIEELYEDRLVEYYQLLAYHYERSDNTAKAVDYLILAGDAAAGLFAHAEARLHYARAVESLAQLADTEENRRRRVDTLFKQTISSWRAEPPEQTFIRLDEAERLVKGLTGAGGMLADDLLRLARLHFWRGRAHYIGGALPEAIGYFKQVLSAAQDAGNAELLTISEVMIGVCKWMQGHLAEAEALTRTAISAFEKTENWLEWIRAVTFHGLFIAWMGDCRAGLAEIERGAARAQEMNSPSEIAFTRIGLTIAHFISSDWSRSIEAASKAVEAGKQSGERIYVYITLGYQGWAKGRAGEFEAGEADILEAQAMGQEFGTNVMFADIFAAARSEIVFEAGRIEEALALAEQAKEIARKMGGIWAGGMARRVWGQALASFKPGCWEEAKVQLSESLRMLESGQHRLEAARTHVAWGIVCREQNDLSAARKHWEKAAARYEASGVARELEYVCGLLAGL